MRVIVLAALATVPALASAQSSAALFAASAIPDAAFAVQAPDQPLSRATIDSVCAARALPLTGSAIFASLRDAMRAARTTPARPVLSPGAATVRATTIAAGWYGVLLFIGLAVLIFAGDRLRQVSDTLERETARSLITGIVADLASIPLLLAVVMLLAITILGILLIPFAVVALLLAYAGLGVLGFLAAASVIGRGLLTRRAGSMSERAAALGGLIVGVTVLLSTWIVAALFTWSPTASLVLRSIAIGLTAVVVTAGVGAVIQSFRPRRAEAAATPAAPDPVAWQTPTPVGGVVAVRRSAG